MSASSVTTVQVSELFAGIQGESTRAGIPCGFIRLSGCNLRCAWCDTRYALDGGKTMAIAEIMAIVQAWDTPLVEITGGEPLLQKGCATLAGALSATGRTTLVETNGSLPIGVLPERVIRIMDIKCPGSGMNDKMRWENLNALNKHDEIKFVLADRKDYEWAMEIMRRYSLAEKCAAVLFSPVTHVLEPAQLANWMMSDKPPARLQLQLHKILWPEETRGV